MNKTLTLSQKELETLTNILDQAADYRDEWREEYANGDDVNMPPLEEDEVQLYVPLERRLRDLENFQPEPEPRIVSQVATLSCTVRTWESDADRPPGDVLRAAFEARMDGLDHHHEWHEAVELDDAVYDDTHQPFTGFEEPR